MNISLKQALFIIIILIHFLPTLTFKILAWLFLILFFTLFSLSTATYHDLAHIFCPSL